MTSWDRNPISGDGKIFKDMLHMCIPMNDEGSPYNSRNRVLNENELRALLLPFDTDTFHDINYYRRAFIHKSYVTRKNENYLDGNTNCPIDCMPLQENSNERLEFLGDSILNLIVARYVFDRYPDDNEGFLTNMRTKLVNGKMLAFLGEKIGLQNHVVISKKIAPMRASNVSSMTFLFERPRLLSICFAKTMFRKNYTDFVVM